MTGAFCRSSCNVMANKEKILVLACISRKVDPVSVTFCFRIYPNETTVVFDACTSNPG